jgi:hypothetical protein
MVNLRDIESEKVRATLFERIRRHTGSNERPRIRRCGTNAGPGTARPLVLGKGKQRSAHTTDSRYPFVINMSGDVLNLGSAICPPMWRR